MHRLPGRPGTSGMEVDLVPEFLRRILEVVPGFCPSTANLHGELWEAILIRPGE